MADPRVKILGDYYPINDILEQNDVQGSVVVQFLVDEQLIDLEDYFFEDEEQEDIQ